MQLYFKKYGTEGKPLIILHGLFGMSDNWHNISRKLSEKYIVYTIDQRNHGQSGHSATMNYSAMADDINELMKQENIDKVTLIGHSMGGKTAMMFANKYPENIDKLIVVDIAPKAYKPGHKVYFEAMKNINYKASTRREIEEDLSKTITDQGEMLFLLKNLYRKDSGEFGLKINLEAIEKNYEAISGEIEFNKPVETPTLFVKGEKSNYISEKDEEEIKMQFKNVEFETVKAAGHWVHAENVEGFIDVVNEFLNE